MVNRVTMSDVARQAGVSLMTVSRVINRREDVHPETRQRVLAVIHDLNYLPSAIARSLASQETRTIGLIIPDVTNPFFADITRGVEHLAYAEGYQVFLCNTEEDPQRELAVIRSLEEKRVDGLVLCSSRLDDSALGDLLSHTPAAVLINRRLSGSASDPSQSILLNEEAAGKMATEHLLRGGHRQVGFLAGPPVSFSGQGRQKGYLAALRAAGIEPQAGWVRHCPPDVTGGCQAALDLLDDFPLLTALFCYNDLVAVGAMQAARQLERRIPRDLAIVGHDDISLAALVSPGLTTCRVARYELGKQAFGALLERIKGCPESCEQILFEPELVVRQSAP